MSSQRFVAVVPVKENSERVPRKNFREFTRGESLFDRKLKQLSSSEGISEVYVSTDSPEVLDTTSTQFVPLKRDKSLCNNLTPWSEVIEGVLDSLPEPDSTVVVWAHTTVPFFRRFEEAIAHFQCLSGEESGFDSVIASSALREFVVGPDGLPVNYAWGAWHDYSQNLPA